MSFEFYLILWIIIGIIFGYFVAKIYFLWKIKKQRKDAVTRSRNVVLGHVNEKIAPLLPNFPYNYKDLMFIGKWVDYIVFDGLSRGNLQEIIFLEIKTNSSTLNKNETMVKNCINQKQVSYEILKM